MGQVGGSIGCRILDRRVTVNAPFALILVHEKRTHKLSLSAVYLRSWCHSNAHSKTVINRCYSHRQVPIWVSRLWVFHLRV
jgi:hypothetical protein